MSKAFSNSHNATVRRLSAGVADYSERMDTHYANAKRLLDGATVRTGDEVTTHWESPQALREWAHENELAEASFQAMLDCGAMQNRALWSAYRRTCWLRVREVIARVPDISVFANTLRQVSTQLIALARSVSPPGLMTAPNILATCHASNAPGLTPNAMNYWQVPARE